MARRGSAPDGPSTMYVVTSSKHSCTEYEFSSLADAIEHARMMATEQPLSVDIWLDGVLIASTDTSPDGELLCDDCGESFSADHCCEPPDEDEPDFRYVFWTETTHLGGNADLAAAHRGARHEALRLAQDVYLFDYGKVMGKYSPMTGLWVDLSDD